MLKYFERRRFEMKTRILIFAIAILAIAVVALGAEEVTANGGTNACTPGYWKNHTAAWKVYTPSQTLGSVFASVSVITGTGGVSLTGDSLLTALNYGGGDDLLGAAKILSRAAVAAILNASHPQVGYPWTAAEIIAKVNAAFASKNRETMISLASELDRKNNSGSCPLDNPTVVDLSSFTVKTEGPGLPQWLKDLAKWLLQNGG
jgi:hypothetical protein